MALLLGREAPARTGRHTNKALPARAGAYTRSAGDSEGSGAEGKRRGKGEGKHTRGRKSLDHNSSSGENYVKSNSHRTSGSSNGSSRRSKNSASESSHDTAAVVAASSTTTTTASGSANTAYCEQPDFVKDVLQHIRRVDERVEQCVADQLTTRDREDGSRRGGGRGRVGEEEGPKRRPDAPVNPYDWRSALHRQAEGREAEGEDRDEAKAKSPRKFVLLEALDSDTRQLVVPSSRILGIGVREGLEEHDRAKDGREEGGQESCKRDFPPLLVGPVPPPPSTMATAPSGATAPRKPHDPRWGISGAQTERSRRRRPKRDLLH